MESNNIERTIIAIYGRQNEGKSATIKKTCETIFRNYPKAKQLLPLEPINYDGDICVLIEISGIKIGFSSIGDPGDYALGRSYDEVWKLAQANCQIIICATRTRGDTTYKVDDIASNHDFDYHTLWISSFFSPKLNYEVLNQLAAENLVEIIKSLIVGRL
ncbi:MAG: hypothetical protein IPM82_12570 [Saprospiraceae bacterium]|nr:hypothetical protein [Saprospiraceae bacterium]